METVNIKDVPLDIRQQKFVSVGDFYQNDTNIIKFTLSDNSNPADLSNVDEILINYKRPDGEIISRLLEAESNIINYQLGQSEMQTVGLGKLVLQFFSNDKRLSTFVINVSVKKSIETNFEFEEGENPLVDQILQKFSHLETINISLLTRILAIENIIRNGELPPDNENSVTFSLVDGELLATYSKIAQDLGIKVELINGELIATDNSNSISFGSFNISDGKLLVTYPN